MTVFTPETNEAEPTERDRETTTTMTNAHDGRRPNTRTDPNRAQPARPMGAVSHTNPLTGQPFGESQVFARGRTVVADGGEADAAEDATEETEDDAEVARVSDVDHTPREGAPDASAVYERGGEGKRDDTAADAEGGTDDVVEADEE
jgi:hypothetical protein